MATSVHEAEVQETMWIFGDLVTPPRWSGEESCRDEP